MFHSKRYRKKSEVLNVFPAFTDLMANAFMILSLFLLLALLQATELNRKLQSAAPIVIDEKSGNFKFPSGSAELTPQLKGYLNDQVVPTLEKIIQEKEGAIDFIQVIGHTDGQANSRLSNLDQKLELVAQNKLSVTNLTSGSNADLGLMRALAVIQQLRQGGQFKNIDFRAYSAGQLYDPQGKIAALNRQPDQSRRRIEIRFIPPGKTR